MSSIAVSIRPPETAPQILPPTSQGGNSTIRLRCRRDLDEPWMAGLVPASAVGTADVVRQARYACWKSERKDSLTALLTVDVDWQEAPDGVWLVFLVYDQPRGLNIVWTVEQRGRTFRPLTDTCRELLSNPSSPRMGLDDMVTSIRKEEYEALIGPRSSQIILPALQGIAHAAPGSEPEVFPFRPGGGRETTAAPRTESRMLVASCQYPAGMLDRTPRHEPAVSPSERTLATVHALHRNEGPIDLMLRLGDQVYVDATAGLADPQLQDGGVAQAYRKWMEAPMASQVVSAIRQAPMLDDHEMSDNWSPVSSHGPSCLEDGRPTDVSAYMERLRDEGVQAFRIHQMTVGAATRQAALHGTCGHDALGQRVFVADTRSDRDCRAVSTLDQAVIMKEAQTQAIEEWLKAQAQGAWHFLASPSMVLPRLRRVAHAPTPAGALLSDAWDGFPASLHRLLWHIHTVAPRRLVLLSGDAHLAHIGRISLQLQRQDAQSREWQPEGAPIVVHCLHAPAMYSPFPFANARRSDYSTSGFDMAHPQDPSLRLHCSIEAWFPTTGEGCFLLTLHDDPTRPLDVALVHTGCREPVAPCPDWLSQSSDLIVTVRQGDEFERSP